MADVAVEKIEEKVVAAYGLVSEGWQDGRATLGLKKLAVDFSLVPGSMWVCDRNESHPEGDLGWIASIYLYEDTVDELIESLEYIREHKLFAGPPDYE